MIFLSTNLYFECAFPALPLVIYIFSVLGVFYCGIVYTTATVNCTFIKLYLMFGLHKSVHNQVSLFVLFLQLFCLLGLFEWCYLLELLLLLDTVNVCACTVTTIVAFPYLPDFHCDLWLIIISSITLSSFSPAFASYHSLLNSVHSPIAFLLSVCSLYLSRFSIFSFTMWPITFHSSRNFTFIRNPFQMLSRGLNCAAGGVRHPFFHSRAASTFRYPLITFLFFSLQVLHQ